MKEPLSNPPICRKAMAYKPYRGKAFKAPSLLPALLSRRLAFFSLVLLSTVYGGTTIATVMSTGGPSYLTWAIIGIFTLLFGWIAATFWTVAIGFVTLVRANEPFEIKVLHDKHIAPDARVAVIMPVYNEDVDHIFSALQAMHESLKEAGVLHLFDFFVLSDSTEPGIYAREEAAWKEICSKTDGENRIFYRRRKVRLHKKSGNIADFCRRWGLKYKYLLPLDADSLMSAACMVDMIKIMEAHPEVGILQSSPRGANQKSFGSRIQQFTSHLYGPLHLAGNHFWQLNDAGFWGHNAILRMAPFIDHCVLPVLPGRPPFGGPILSHDFVEAALMRRAGWEVWLVYRGLDESYEELPPDLLEELARDKRWCQGNLQHLRLVFMPGFSFGHRLLFLHGNMAYFSSFFWFLLLVLLTVHAFLDSLYNPPYFSDSWSLFPHWPVHYPALSIQLLTLTAIFLFFPKVLSLVWVLWSGQNVKLFGGWGRLLTGVVLETLFSILLAPIKMVFHSWFVMVNLAGGKLEWKKQKRHMQVVSWGQAFATLIVPSLAAIAWGYFAFYINQTMFLWIMPIVLPLAFSIPIVVVSSFPALGNFFRKRQIFLVPVESSPPPVLVRFNQILSGKLTTN
jgi:membrane glycosyltransferase